VIFSAVLGCVLVFAWWQVDALYSRHLLTEAKARLMESLTLYGNSLTTSVNRRFALLEGLAAFARTRMRIGMTNADFDSFAAGLFASAPGIRAIQAMPGGLTRFVYPLAGNETVLGHSLFDEERPNVRADVQRALDTRRVALSGPYELRQGGLGLVARQALYDGDAFWGFVTIVLQVREIMEGAGLAEEPVGIRIGIRTSKAALFWGSAEAFAPDSIEYVVMLPEGSWQLAALPSGGWRAAIRGPLVVFRVVSLLIVLLIAAAAALLLDRERALRRMVGERTRDLSETLAVLDALFDNSAVGMCLVDRSLRFLRVNDPFGGLDGLPVEAHLGRSIGEVSPGLTSFASLCRAVVETAAPVVNAEISVPSGRLADRERHWLASCFPIPGPDASPASIGAVVIDITGRREAEEEVRALNVGLEKRVQERTADLTRHVGEVEKLNGTLANLLEDFQSATRRAEESARWLESANKELETFSYSVSHDLKAPLRGIDGYSKLVLEKYADKLDEEGRGFLMTLRASAKHMSRLIDDLLAYSRVERRAMSFTSVEAGALVESLLAEKADEIATRGVAVRVDVTCGKLTVEVEGLAMALRNLLDNALKFTRETASPRIEIGGRSSNERCTLWVRDNGIGFDMKYHDRIFEIFQRLNRPEDYAGTGIGLAIVAKAMHRMGGRAWAEGEPGRGAVFYLELPHTSPGREIP
jgi:PAS domain S-box-containing protein